MNKCLIYIVVVSIVIAGCATTLNISYDPAYIAGRNNDHFRKSKSILVLPYKDNRNTEDPCHIFENVKLGDQTLSEYLHAAINKDLKMMGFNVVESIDKIEFNDIRESRASIDPSINIVLYVEVNECTPDYKMNWTTIEPYSIFNFNVSIWDNVKKSIVYEDQLSKKIMGTETSAATFKYMVEKLLNDDLAIINVDIAELLATY